MKKQSNKKMYLLIFVLVLFFTEVQGWGFITRTGDSIIIKSDEIVDEDLYLAGKSIMVEGTVNGDLWVAGKQVIISGNVQNNASVIGENINMLGTTGKSFKALGNTIRVDGNIRGDLLVFGKDVELTSKADLRGDFLLGAKSATVNGNCYKDLVGVGKDITINGKVGGNIKLGVDALTVTSNARIQGDLTYFSRNEALIFPGAEIKGMISQKLPQYWEEWSRVSSALHTWGKVAGFFMILLTGLVFILITPHWMRSSADAIRNVPGKCAAWGALIIFVTPLGVALAMATIIGIPLAFIAIFLYIIGLIISQVVSGLFLGRLILSRWVTSQTKGTMFLSFFLGTVIISVLRYVPVVEYIIIFLTFLFGMGSLVLSRKTRK